MTSRSPVAFRRLSVVTALVTYLLIVWGGVVRVSGSGAGCGTQDGWPLCHGGWLPPWQQEAIIEFTHRWLVALSTTLVVALVVAAMVRWQRARRGNSVPRDVAERGRTALISGLVLALFIVQIALGAVTVKFDLPGYVVAVHLANAEFLLGALILLAVRAHIEGTVSAAGPHRRSPAFPAAAVAAAATYVLVITGSVVVARGAGAACSAWPLCGNGLELSTTRLATINLLHRVVAAGVIAAIGIAVMRVRKVHPSDLRVRLLGVVATALLLAQVIAGAVVVEAHLPPVARGIHLALASALWAVVLLVALLVRTAPPAVVVGGGDQAAPAADGPAARRAAPGLPLAGA